MDQEQTIDTIIQPLALNENFIQPQQKQSLRELVINIFNRIVPQRRTIEANWLSLERIVKEISQLKISITSIVQDIANSKILELFRKERQHENQPKSLLSFSRKSSEQGRSGFQAIERHPPVSQSKGLSFRNHSSLLSSLSESSNKKRQASQQSRTFHIFQGNYIQSLYDSESIKISERKSMEVDKSSKQQEKALGEQKSEKILKEFPKKSIHALRPKPNPANASSK